MSGSDKYEYEAHCFCGKLFSRLVCHKCGLMTSKNELTQLAIKMGCNHTLHPGWKKSVHYYTKHNGDKA